MDPFRRRNDPSGWMYNEGVNGPEGANTASYWQNSSGRKTYRDPSLSAIPMPPGAFTDFRDLSARGGIMGSDMRGAGATALDPNDPNMAWRYHEGTGWTKGPRQSSNWLEDITDPFGEFMTPIMTNPLTYLALGAPIAAPALGGAAGAAAGTDAALAAGGETLGSGLTLGSTGAGGLSTAAGGATGLTAPATGLGALSAGSFAGESLYPVVGGMTAGSIAGSTAGSAAANGAANAFGISPEMARLLGIAGITGLGMYGADKQADSLRGIAAAAEAKRLPFYNKSLEYLNNPGAYISGPGKASLDATLRALSARHGNPIGSPTALGIATEAGMRDWRDAVTGYANLGLSGEDARLNLQGQATGADANVLNALGYGIGQATNPPTTLEQLLRSMRGSSVSVV